MSEKFIEEKNVSIEAISDLFKSAFLRVSEIDEDNSFKVTFDNIMINVSIDEELKRIRFFDVNLVEDESYEEAVLKVHEIVKKSIMVRTYIAQDNEGVNYILSDYMMSYEMGIIPFQVVNMAKLFELVVVNNLRTFFKTED